MGNWIEWIGFEGGEGIGVKVPFIVLKYFNIKYCRRRKKQKNFLITTLLLLVLIYPLLFIECILGGFNNVNNLLLFRIYVH